MCARIMLQRKICTGTWCSSCSCFSSTSHAHLVQPYLHRINACLPEPSHFPDALPYSRPLLLLSMSRLPDIRLFWRPDHL